MCGMNMISDTYRPDSAAVLHIGTEVWVDLHLFKANLYRSWGPDTLEGQF